MLARLALVPGLRILLCLCDPVKRLDYVLQTKAAYRWPGGRGLAELPTAAELMAEFAEELQDPADGAFFALRLSRVLELFPPERVFVLHLDAVRLRPREVYANLTAFLGVPPLPAAHAFAQKNRHADGPARTRAAADTADAAGAVEAAGARPM